ncbi:MAG TPA: tRNA uridine-5-carboxymethylaminomethyl(34) synthesis GTPase MnmE [Pyrinomonadaceae bacterium]|nr:tRNA uridine-5-carboxymethylaminomethyl(34) synthesis GTPase MnmE [Pyrinomonadaceae bacterium]HMP64643.1 tRNA uridine-5-carboxymethylaminomethyl(34) synthesis GTPase MnmE [Pyrinomonadaceae bacterium]
MSDTIVAHATPIGRSGIGVVRLSGPDAVSIAGLLAGRRRHEPEPRTATLAPIVDPETGEAIDEAVITYFKGPASFTGEDVVEIACHGSPVVLRQVIDVCLRQGARMAGPGEFSLRALANGKIDLSEAEAIRDLIDAQTATAARQAVRQMRGEISHRLAPVKDELLDVIVVLESALEFVEDDLPELQAASIAERLDRMAKSLDSLASTFKAGHLIREGLRVALVGRPNVGKSSLFNALLGSDRAIVTEVAGTTRDQLHERFTIDDIPISLIDTAGLRYTTDLVESIGVERSRKAMADADLVMVMLDASEPLTAEDAEIIESVRELRHLILVNKIDKIDRDDGYELPGRFRDLLRLSVTPLAISAKTGEGVEALKMAIIGPFAPGEMDVSGFLLTDARHFDLLERAQQEVRGSIDLIREGTSEEIVLVGLHNSLRYLSDITGETTTEDMLTRIFSTFCIGK